MPNWTFNTVELKGKESNIKRFLEVIGANEEEETLSFNTLVPEPDGLMDRPDETIDGITLPGWYHWRRLNWGTKWDLSELTIDNPGAGHRFMQFSTAWDAPREYIDAFVKEANKHDVLVWWDATHEDGWVEESIVAVRREAV